MSNNYTRYIFPTRKLYTFQLSQKWTYDLGEDLYYPNSDKNFFLGPKGMHSYFRDRRCESLRVLKKLARIDAFNLKMKELK